MAQVYGAAGFGGTVKQKPVLSTVCRVRILICVVRAATSTVAPLGLIYAYCVSHRGRATALLALVATIVAVLVIGFAIVIPKATAS